MQTKVSVIIPVYNTALYLSEALDSICNQTLKELEIIVINDGSTDNSLEIIKKYAEKDKRITYYSQQNQGQGAARNLGLSHAIGEYIYFMDSDDILKSNALEDCYEICENESLDFVCFDAESFGDTSNQIPAYDRSKIIDSSILWIGEALLEDQLKKYAFSASSCLCFCKKSFLKEYFSGFPIGIIHEDQVFVVNIMLHAQRVKYVPKKFFKRRIRPYSTMTNNFSMNNIKGYMHVCNQIRNYIILHAEWKEVVGLYLNVTLNAVIWNGYQLPFSDKLSTLKYIWKFRFMRYIKIRNWLVFWFKLSKS